MTVPELTGACGLIPRCSDRNRRFCFRQKQNRVKTSPRGLDTFEPFYPWLLGWAVNPRHVAVERSRDMLAGSVNICGS